MCLRDRDCVGIGLVLAMLSACSGSGAGGGTPLVSTPAPTPTPTPSPTPSPGLAVTLSAPSVDITVDEGKTVAFGFVANFTGTSSHLVYADVAIGGKRYALDKPLVQSGMSFTVALRTAASAPGGKATSTVTFRLCTTPDCTTVYPGSTATYTVNLDVKLKDWATFQRDTAHTGYVAASYKTADFAEAWSVPNATDSAPFQIAARRGTVFMNLRRRPNGLFTRALDTTNGTTVWEYDLGPKLSYSGPGYSNGRIITATTTSSSNGETPIDLIDADKGTRIGGAIFDSAAGVTPGTPTIIDDDLYYAGGYYGNSIVARDLGVGNGNWGAGVQDIGYVGAGETLAADDGWVYFFNAGGLYALSRHDAFMHHIANPFFSRPGVFYSGQYDGGPILDGAGRVFTFMDNRVQTDSLPLIAFSTKSDSLLWHTARSYTGDPALRSGKLYAIRGNSALIDIIDVVNGTVSGTIDLGADKGVLGGNVVVTDSHLFVSNGSATYAVDLQQPTYPIVWSTAHGGALAITPDNQLVVETTTGGVYAYRLA